MLIKVGPGREIAPNTGANATTVLFVFQNGDQLFLNWLPL